MNKDEVIAYLFRYFIDQVKWKEELKRLRELRQGTEPIDWSDEDIRATMVLVVVAQALITYGTANRESSSKGY